MTDLHSSQVPLLKNATMGQLEAFVQVVVLVAYADGELSTIEERVLVQNIRRLTDGRIDEKYLSNLMVEFPVQTSTDNDWPATKFAQLSSAINDDELRKEAFFVAATVARSEKGIGLREMRLLLSLASELRIELSFAQGLLNQPRQLTKTLIGPL